MPSPVRQILLIRLSAIGDVIMSTSLLPGLRARYPEAEITWPTEGIGAEVLDGHPLVDRVLKLPRKEWRRLWKEGRRFEVLRRGWAFRRELRAARFDLVIDLQGLLKSALWAWGTGAPRRVSLRGREHSSWLMTETVHDPLGMGGQLCREYRLLATHLGLPEASFGMRLHPLPAEEKRADATLAGSDRAPIFLFPFTTRPQKHWFADRWSVLARELAATGHPVWILGGPTDQPGAAQIAAEAGVEVGIVAGPESDLKEKIALVSRAALSIGVDTGLTHLSLGLGRPTVALFGSTCPYIDTAPVPGRVLYDQLECSPCRRHPTCDGAFTCMRQLSVERVLAASRELLAR